MAEPDAYESGGICWQLSAALPPERAQARVRAAVAALEAGSGELWKERPNKTLQALALGDDGRPDHLLKEHRYPGGLRWPRVSKALHELSVAETALARGVRTPLAVAAGERRRKGRVEASYLLTELRRAATDLRQIWLGDSSEGLVGSRRRGLVTEFGRFVGRIHAAGLEQDDFAPNNFLVEWDPEPRFWMIDFERTRVRRRIGIGARRRMLAKLERELARSSRSDRMRFLRAYATGEGHADATGQGHDARGWWRAIEDEIPRLARRDARRIARTETRPEGAFPPRAIGAWRGWSDPGLGSPTLEEILASPEPPKALWRTPLAVRGARDARRQWALAHLLFRHRGLAPHPLALLHRDGLGWLIAAREPTSAPLDSVVDPAARRSAEGALCVLLARLLALGRLAELPPTQSIALLPGPEGGITAQLLDPGFLRPGGPLAPGRRALASRGAAELVG